MKTCTYCKKEINEEFNFCPYCGEAISDKAKELEVAKIKQTQIKTLNKLATVTDDNKTLEIIKTIIKKIM